jgi:SAM-dependent methyltransferase
MDWVRVFYEKQDEWTGTCRERIDACHLDQAGRVDRVLAGRAGRVLELGCGGGQTASALAAMGHSVVAIDQSPRAIAAAQERVEPRFASRLQFVLADFFAVNLEGRFDVICYFDGFGIGEDEDQRRLLGRMGGWLAPEGVALLDVYTPWYWAGASGQTMQFEDACRRYGFDAEAGRMLDTWWPADHPETTVTQSLRCYGPADLRLLLRGTGLELVDIRPGGALDREAGESRNEVPLAAAMSFSAALRRTH